MNDLHLNFICKKFKLGLPKKTVTKVMGSRGGSLMWRVNTEQGRSYAIKQLAPDIDLKNTKVAAKYELSETIAYRFSQQGISAAFAIEESGHRLTIIDNIGYLVYPWVEGYTLQRNEVSEPHALKIAEITAKLHSINLIETEIGPIRFDIHSNESIINAIEKAVLFKCPFAKTLKEKQHILLSLNQNFLEVIPILKEYAVVTHGDLDQLNIIWNQKNEPTLIDWESARKMNPTHEIIRTSLRFSGVGTNNFSLSIYSNMLHTYERSGGILNKNHIEATLHALSGSTINWLLYNIESVCTNHVSEERNRACKEIEEVLVSIDIKRSQALMSQLLKVK